MRAVIQDIPVPAHWEDRGTYERPGGGFFHKENATYRRFFTTDWSDGKECAVLAGFSPECDVKVEPWGRCHCTWKLPDFSWTADKSIPRYVVAFAIELERGSRDDACVTMEPVRSDRVCAGPASVTLSIVDGRLKR